MPMQSNQKWIASSILVLSFLLLVQIFWFIGTTTLQDYENIQKNYLQLADDISRISAAAQTSDGQSSENAKALIEPLDKKLRFLEPQMESAVAAIKTWNATWQWLIFWGESSSDDGAGEHGQLRHASGATQVLGLYVLPLLYGLLGSLLWVVQKIRESQSDAELRGHRPSARVATGVIAGPLIGMFISPEVLNSLAFQATPFLLAFLGGYSTDLFFGLIDKFLSGVRNALDRPEEKSSGPPNEQAPKGHPSDASTGHPH